MINSPYEPLVQDGLIQLKLPIMDERSATEIKRAPKHRASVKRPKIRHSHQNVRLPRISNAYKTNSKVPSIFEFRGGSSDRANLPTIR